MVCAFVSLCRIYCQGSGYGGGPCTEFILYAVGKKGRDRYPGIDEGLFVSLCLSRCSQFVKHEKVKLAFWEFIQKQGSKDENNIEYFIDKENQEIVFKEINRAIDGLPFQCRQIFLLSRFSGKKSQEIAVELGISVRTVEAQLYRAMKRLREELAHLRGSAIFWLFLLRGEKV